MNKTVVKIVFFDGYCGLCSHTVDFLMARDRHRRLRYSPLQGETAKRLLTEEERTDMNTAILAVESATSSDSPSNVMKLKRSDAILSSLLELPRWSLVARLLLLVPVYIRDAVYTVIAHNRFYLVKKRDTCRVPSPSEKALFLP